MGISKEEYFKELEILEKDYNHLISHFNFNFPKPLNLKEEKRKFFMHIADDKPYNPHFKYEKKVFDEERIEDLKNFKINVKNDLYNFKKLYKERLLGTLHQIEYHRRWGKPESTKYILNYWGKPSIFLLMKAKKFCKSFQREKVKFKTLSPRIAGNRLKKEVKRLTGDDIKVKYVDINAKMNISPKHNLIQINPAERFTSLDIKRLKVHEIGVHYMRYYNGHRMSIDLLERGTANYIETEEGLAAYTEFLKGVSSKAQLFVYAGRVIATYYAPKKSFFEVFQILKSYGFNDEVAFSITFRAKRNMCDTSQKGGFTKDYVYFKGFYRIEKYAKKNDIRNLFIGKIKIEDVKLLKKFISENKYKIVTIFDEEFNSKK